MFYSRKANVGNKAETYIIITEYWFESTLELQNITHFDMRQ